MACADRSISRLSTRAVQLFASSISIHPIRTMRTHPLMPDARIESADPAAKGGFARRNTYGISNDLSIHLRTRERIATHMATAVGQFFEALGELPRHWWVVALRGLAAIVFGILTFIWPNISLAVLILFFGAYAIVDGVLGLYAATQSRGEHVWAPVLEGLLSIAAGLVAFFWPGVTALALLFVIATWAILTGVIEVYAAIRLRRVIDNEWALVLSGVLSVVFGILLLVQPGAGVLTVVWLIGGYAIAFGIAMLVFAFRLRDVSQHLPRVSPAPRTTPA